MLFAAKASAQMVAVNTDVAMDACMAPSLGVELTLGKKSTLNINGLYAANMLGKDIRIAAMQPNGVCISQDVLCSTIMSVL